MASEPVIFVRASERNAQGPDVLVMLGTGKTSKKVLEVIPVDAVTHPRIFRNKRKRKEGIGEVFSLFKLTLCSDFFCLVHVTFPTF